MVQELFRHSDVEITDSAMFSVHSMQSGAIALDLKPTSTGSYLIKINELSFERMLNGDVVSRHTYRLVDDIFPHDWKSAAIYSGHYQVTTDITSLTSTQVYWVGEGTCDANDSYGSQKSIIYIATSFGQ